MNENVSLLFSQLFIGSNGGKYVKDLFPDAEDDILNVMIGDLYYRLGTLCNSLKRKNNTVFYVNGNKFSYFSNSIDTMMKSFDASDYIQFVDRV